MAGSPGWSHPRPAAPRTARRRAPAAHGPLEPAPDGAGGWLRLPGGSGTVQARRAGKDERAEVAAAPDPRRRAAARDLLFWHPELEGELTSRRSHRCS